MDLVTLPVQPVAPEIIWFTPSETFLQTPEYLLNAVSDGSKGNGMVRNYWGVQLDAPQSRVWVMVWQSLAHHQAFMEDEAYVDVVLPVMEAMVGHGDVAQVLLGSLSDLERALSSPLVQFVYITVRPLHDRAYELVPLIEKLKRETKTISGCFGACWGPCLEQDSVQVGVVGWRSHEDRDHAVNGRLSPIIARIREFTTVELKYAKMKRHH